MMLAFGFHVTKIVSQMYQAKKPVVVAQDMKDQSGAMHPSPVNKMIDRIDDHLRAWIKDAFFSVANR